MSEMWTHRKQSSTPGAPQERSDVTPYARLGNAVLKVPSIHNTPAKGFLMESRMHGNMHVRFGERGRRNHDEESPYRRFRLYSTRPTTEPRGSRLDHTAGRGRTFARDPSSGPYYCGTRHLYEFCR